jgi:hypothetical protein
LNNDIAAIYDFVQLFPNSLWLSCRHSFVSVFQQFFIVLNFQVKILFRIVLFVFNAICHLFEIRKTHFGLFSSTLRSKCLFICLDFQKSDFIFLCWVLEQRCWYFFRFYVYFCGIFLFFGHFDSQFLQGFLIDCPYVTKPFPVWIDSGGLSWSFVHFLFIGHFLSVHLEPFDSIGRPQRVVLAISISLNLSIGIGGWVGFALFIKFAMKTLIISCQGFLFLGHFILYFNN